VEGELGGGMAQQYVHTHTHTQTHKTHAHTHIDSLPDWWNMIPFSVSSSGATKRGKMRAQYVSTEGLQKQHSMQHSIMQPQHPPP